MCVCCEEGSTIVSSCFPEASFFFKHPLYVSFAKVFFYFLIFFFTWSLEILKFPFTWNYNLIHNSMFFLRGPLLCPAASWVLFSNNPFSWSFAINIPYTFSFAKVFFSFN